MFNVNCSLADLREDHDKDILEVKSCEYNQKTKVKQVYIRIIPGENDPSRAVEMLVNADDLRLAIEHATANESSITYVYRYRHYSPVEDEGSDRA